MKEPVTNGRLTARLATLLAGMSQRSLYRSGGDLKIGLTGSPQAGKSVLLGRFTAGTYRDDLLPVQGYDLVRHVFTVRTAALPAGSRWQQATVEEKARLSLEAFKTVPVQLWDFSGHARVVKHLGQYLRGMAALLLVFDRSDPASIQGLEDLLVPVRKFQPSAPAILVAAKGDLANRTSPGAIDRFMGRHHVNKFITTSARNGTGVEEAFNEAFKLALQALHGQSREGTGTEQGRTGSNRQKGMTRGEKP